VALKGSEKIQNAGDLLILDQARPHEWAAALELVFAGLDENDRQRHIVNTLALLASRTVDPGGLWLARSAETLVGVQLCELLGGATCLFWPPAIHADFRDTGLAEWLLRTGVDWSRQRGSKVAQAMLSTVDSDNAVPFLCAGFTHVTDLLILRHDLYDLLIADDKLRYKDYRAAGQELFAQALLRTYEGTRDCPELNGARTVDEILAGHRAAGKDRPELWQLAFAGEQPIGVLMLTELPDGLDWELSYLGIIPEARRRGFGRVLAQHALTAARREDALHLLVAVDCRNEPARTLYRALGFETVEARRVLLRFLEVGSSKNQEPRTNEAPNSKA
jgi:mycothiol synthase